MIVGLGTDFCDARRIAKSIERFGDRFLERVFTPGERAKADRRMRRAETYAKRFAAKEACSKALGTGLSHGVFWRDMEVVNLPSGKPTLQLTGGAAARLKAMVPPGYQAYIELSLTDEGPLCAAYVIISAEPGPRESGLPMGASTGEST